MGILRQMVIMLELMEDKNQRMKKMCMNITQIQTLMNLIINLKKIA